MIGFLLGIAVMLLFQEYSQPKFCGHSEPKAEPRMFPHNLQHTKVLSYSPPQAQEKEEDDPVVYHLPPGQAGRPVAMLTAFEGMYKGFSWTLNYSASNTIGRFNDCDIALNDHSISRLHAQITHNITASNSNQFALFDYSRRNQTLINGEPINAVASLRDGDQVKIGRMEFIFRRI
jgi:hypothetical protein